MMSSHRFLGFVGATIMLGHSFALATPYDDVADGNWSAPGTWDVGVGFPSLAADTALINQTRSITVDVSPTFDSLTVTGNAVQTLSAGSAQTITVNEFFSGNINNFIIDTNVSLDLTTTGTYQTRGGTINGAFNVLNGATLTYTNNQAQNGSGNIHVASGGKIDMQSNSFYNQFDGATGMTIDNDGLFEFNNTGSFRIQALNITGDGQWTVNSGGAAFNNASQTITLNPATGGFDGSDGTVKFDNAAAATHSLGAFSMSGTNLVQFDAGAGALYQLNRTSTFQDLSLTSSNSLDLAPSGTGGLTHAVNGTLTITNSSSLIASDAAGAVLNVVDLVRSSLGNAVVGSDVTVNVSNSGSLSGNTTTTLDGEMRLLDGVTLTTTARDLLGSGTLTIDPGATFELDGTSNSNFDIEANVVNNGLVTSINNDSRDFENTTISGTGTFRAVAGTFDMDASSANVVGWGDGSSGELDTQATWHTQDAGIIDLRGSNNSIDTIGTDTTVILEDGGSFLQLNTGARNNLVVEGGLQVRGTADLLFNVGQGVTVNSDGTLGGDGAISGLVTVLNGGNLAPGNSPGTLSLNNGLLLSDTSLLDFELDMSGIVGAGVNDLIDITGDLTLDGKLMITDLGSFGSGTYRLFDYTGTLTDNVLDVVSVPEGFMAEVDLSTANQVNLIVSSSVPEPSSLSLLVLGALGLVRTVRRRK